MNKKDLADLTVLFQWTRKYWRRFLHVFFWIAVVALMRLPMPLFMKYIVDDGLIKKNMQLINMLALAYLGLLLITFGAHVVKNYVSVLLRERVVYDIKMKLYQHIQSLPHSFFHSKSTGYLMSRITSDVGKVESLFSDNMLGVLIDLVTLVAGLCVMFYFHWQLTLLCLALLPFYIFSLFAYGEKIKRGSRAMQENVAQVSANMQEGLSGFSVIKSFRREKYEALRLSQRLREAIKSRIRLMLLLTYSTTTTASIGAVAPLVVLWYGGYQVIQGNLTIGEMVAFSGFLNYLFGPTQKLINLNFMLKDSLAAFERVLELLGLKPEIADRPGSRDVAAVRGEVAYRDVSFSYDGRQPVLQGVSFETGPGEIVALAGKSGAGKSTFLNLLPRFYDPQSGDIRLDGRNVNEYRLRSLRRHIGVVLQETFLFVGTIEENIRYGKPRATIEEVQQAARAANAHDFIMALPDGYATTIGERGARLSGGERQRIAIARVILKGSRVLVLDEATSQLDSESEYLIQQALEKLKKDKTIFVIAHRLSTILSADRVLVLEQGCIVGDGTHKELYTDNAAYRMIFDQQFRGESDRPAPSSSIVLRSSQ